MQIEYDRETCIGMFQCAAEYEAFTEDRDHGKVELADAEEVREDIFARSVPADEETDAKFAARACPVDAITVYDDDGDQLVP